jgi:hypothetical protein
MPQNGVRRKVTGQRSIDSEIKRWLTPFSSPEAEFIVEAIKIALSSEPGRLTAWDRAALNQIAARIAGEPYGGTLKQI